MNESLTNDQIKKMGYDFFFILNPIKDEDKKETLQPLEFVKEKLDQCNKEDRFLLSTCFKQIALNHINTNYAKECLIEDSYINAQRVLNYLYQLGPALPNKIEINELYNDSQIIYLFRKMQEAGIITSDKSQILNALVSIFDISIANAKKYLYENLSKEPKSLFHDYDWSDLFEQ